MKNVESVVHFVEAVAGALEQFYIFKLFRVSFQKSFHLDPVSSRADILVMSGALSVGIAAAANQGEHDVPFRVVRRAGLSHVVFFAMFIAKKISDRHLSRLVDRVHQTSLMSKLLCPKIPKVTFLRHQNVSKK